MHCAVQIAYGWDEKKQTFTRYAPCRCPGYVTPPEDRGCPHEYVSTDAHCVHCHQARVTR